MGADNVDYVACTTASCSSYDLEQMPSEVAGAIAGMTFGLDGLPRMVAWDSAGVVDYIRRHVAVNITGSSGIPLGHSGGFQVDIGSNPGGTQITLAISTNTGTGDATFNGGGHSITLGGSATVPVLGVTVSSTADNMTLKALDSNNDVVASTTFTVVWVTLDLRSGTGVTPSGDDAAAGYYESKWGTNVLKAFADNNSGGCYTGVELFGKVQPSNYTGRVVLRRTLLNWGVWTGSDLNGEVTQPADDTSDPRSRDDDPQSGGSNGFVYDLDAPGVLPHSGNIAWRARQNFSEYAVLDSQSNDTPVSDPLAWFSAVSCITPDFTEYSIATDVTGDSVAGKGTGNLSWDLK